MKTLFSKDKYERGKNRYCSNRFNSSFSNKFFYKRTAETRFDLSYKSPVGEFVDSFYRNYGKMMSQLAYE